MSSTKTATGAPNITPIAAARSAAAIPAAPLNAQILKLGGDTVDILHYPGVDELLPGDVLEACEAEGSGLVIQIVSTSSASYAGAAESAMQEVLETAATEKYDLINREQGLPDLKRMKLATAKIRRRIRGGAWQPW